VLTGDRKSTETPLFLERLSLCHGGLGRDDNGIEDETVLEALHLAHHLGLIILGAVVVNHTETSKQSDVYGHVVFGNSVHGRGDEWCLEGNALRNWGIKGDIDGGEACIIVLGELTDRGVASCVVFAESLQVAQRNSLHGSTKSHGVCKEQRIQD
jgi:hypothetical protein